MSTVSRNEVLRSDAAVSGGLDKEPNSNLNREDDALRRGPF